MTSTSNIYYDGSEIQIERAVVILSGGLDSTTLLYDCLNRGVEVTSCVSFDYGQKHNKEVEFAQATCEQLGLTLHKIGLWSSGFTEAIASAGSSLTTSNDVPEGHYAEKNMKSTVVPNRNMVMISIATSIAVAEGAQAVAVGVHSGDHAIYPDCRPDFIMAVSNTARLANEGFGSFERVIAPYVHLTKADIALCALELCVPIDKTWSCYKGGNKHCGKCGTCVERREAFDEAGRRFDPEHYNQHGVNGFDTTEYEDPNYWKMVTA